VLSKPDEGKERASQEERFD